MAAMKHKAKYLIIAAVAFAFAACNNDKTKPGYTFMDDMYYSPSLGTYETSTQFANGTVAQLPVEGTVPRGYTVYEYPNTNEGYEAARTGLTMPAEFLDSASLEKGKALYGIFCVQCHGEKGDGNGWLVQQEKILGVPSYDKTRLPDITAGSMYHVIVHGKNVMGSHASQLNYDERWQIVRYVQQLRGEQNPETAAPADTVVATEIIDQKS
jgi:mono/diheme cytochrome c family protein